MRAGRQSALVLLVLFWAPVVRAEARHVPDPLAALGELLHGLIPFLGQAADPTPQAVAPADPGGPTVDPSRLGSPVALERELRAALTDPPSQTRLSVIGGLARLGAYSLGSNEVYHGNLVVLEGDAEIHGKLEGNLVTLDGDIIVHPGGEVHGDVLAINGRVEDIGGRITGARSTLEPSQDSLPRSILPLTISRAAGFLGVFATLVVLGFGVVTFGRPNLEIVSDTVVHSFGRAFLAGVLGQVLLLPTFGMLIVGLVLTIAGALLVPFAALVYLILAIAAAVGGLLAVAHAMGETITRRRMARGLAVSPNSYRYLMTGLLAISLVWLAWIAIGWVPVAGALTLVAASLATWSVATVGFGAALLSRGGMREEFSGRLLPAAMMTDEYLWATPQLGVPAVIRPHKTPE